MSGVKKGQTKCAASNYKTRSGTNESCLASTSTETA